LKKYLPVILSIIAVIILAVLYYLLVSGYIDKENQGTFGDMFGGLTALFSGLAFAFLIYSIHLQSNELKLQRRELELQREELRLTREEMKLAREEHSKSAIAQKDLVEKQLLTAQITGVSAIVQGRYQYASAFGANAPSKAAPARRAEMDLKELLKDTGLKDLD